MPEDDYPHLEDPTTGEILHRVSPEERAAIKELGEPPLVAWWSLRLPNGGGIHMGVQDSGDGDKPWVVTDVYVHSDAISGGLMQSVPVGQLDLIMNLVGGFDPDTIAEAANSLGQHVIADPEDEPSLSQMRAWAESSPEGLPNPEDASRPRLERPDGSDPESFYALVAAAYREYALQTRAPAVQIAAEAGVPVATARSWVREARRRGKLPQGHRGMGKAG